MTPALQEELERRHVCVTEEVELAGRVLSVLKPRSADALISEDDFAVDERLPYWADLWPSGRVLATEVARERGGGAACLEMGCGLGLVSIAAMGAGYDVTATDYYDDALAFTRVNALRALGGEPRTCLLDWRRLPADLGTFRRVLAADVLYERAYGPLVAETIHRVLAPDGVATVADPGRVAAPAFVRAAGALGLRICGAPVLSLGDGPVTHRVTLYELRRG